MSDLIAWYGFAGAWLLVIGPLGQAVRELEDEEFERDSLIRAAHQVEKPPPISAWLWLTPPVYYVLRRRHDRVYRERITAVMKSEELDAYVLALVGAMLLVCSARLASRLRRHRPRRD